MKILPISRRRLLQAAGLLVAGTAIPGFNVAFADAPVEQRFILYIQRGAADGIGLIPPYGDKDYKDARNGLALGDSTILKLDNFFGAAPELATFAKFFAAGEAAAVHAVASPYRERSHFDAQNVLETGLTAPARVHEGWLNRVLAIYGMDRGSKLGLAFGQAVPLVAQGDMPMFCWAPTEQGLPEKGLLTALGKIYEDDPLFKAALEGAIGVHGMLDTAENTVMAGEKKSDTIISSPAEFASGSELKMVPNKIAVQNAMHSIGSLLSNPKGPRIAVLDQGGWDTHILQEGLLAFNAGLLDTAFESLKQGLGEHWKNTVMMVVTEFGRMVAQNGTKGTDHGTGSCTLLAGGALAGGKVFGEWPGLAKDKLYMNRDLNPTTDMRSIAKAIIIDHLGLPEKETAHVFPDSDKVRPLEGLIKKV